MKQSIKSPYTKMYMVTPSVYDKLLNCIDENQQKILNNLNQKTTNIFQETPASKFIKNISNDDFIQRDSDKHDDDFPSHKPKDDYPEEMSPQSDDERNIPPGYRDDDFIPPIDEPHYEYDPSMPIIENITPMQHHTIENQPTHVEIPMEITKNVPQTSSTSIQTEIPTQSKFIQTELPTQSQSTQTQGPIYMERGTSPGIDPQYLQPSTSGTAVKKPRKKILSSKHKKLQYKQPKAIEFKRKKLVITELPQEEQPIPKEAITYQPKLPVGYKTKKPLQYDKLHQKKLTTKQPKHLTFKRKKLVITEMEPDEPMIQQPLPPIEQVVFKPVGHEVRQPIDYKINLPISHQGKKAIQYTKKNLPVSYETKLPIAYQSKKAIAHQKKEAIEYIKPLQRIATRPKLLKEIVNQPSSSNQPLKITYPSSIPKITDKLFSKKPPIVVNVPEDVPQITDLTSTVKALKYVPQKSKKLEDNPDSKPYPCNECNLSYTTKFGLNRHKMNKHSEKKISQNPEEKFETWLDYPQKRTSTYAKIKAPPQKYKKSEEFEAWN